MALTVIDKYVAGRLYTEDEYCSGFIFTSDSPQEVQRIDVLDEADGWFRVYVKTEHGVIPLYVLGKRHETQKDVILCSGTRGGDLCRLEAGGFGIHALGMETAYLCLLRTGEIGLVVDSASNYDNQ